MSCDHSTLLRALKNKQPGAFEELYMEFYQLLFFQAFRILGDEFLAKDTVQDVFLKFLENKHFEHIHTSLESYLCVMVHNESKSYLKKEKKLKEKKQLYALETHATTDEADGYERLQQKQQELTYQQSVQHLRTSVSELPPMQQKALRLVHFERMSYEDAAQAMGSNFFTFRTQLARAMKAVRTKLNKEK